MVLVDRCTLVRQELQRENGVDRVSEFGSVPMRAKSNKTKYLRISRHRSLLSSRQPQQQRARRHQQRSPPFLPQKSCPTASTVTSATSSHRDARSHILRLLFSSPPTPLVFAPPLIHSPRHVSQPNPQRPFSSPCRPLRPLARFRHRHTVARHVSHL